MDGPALAPPLGTVERWAWDYVTTCDLAHKLAPRPVPATWEIDAPARRLVGPGRPPELRVAARAEKVRGLRLPLGRARALHAFLHHELQAAELMCWALLAFPAAPLSFRHGLIRIALDEIRHMALYRAQIERLGFHFGAFDVRDWFWSRVPRCPDPAAFVAVMGLGLESANLEHSALFAARFRDVGDEEGARVQEIVGREEIAHVRFGVRWFSEFTGGLDFGTWSRSLPPPLSPLLMKGRPLQRDARRRAGQPEAFLDALESWVECAPSGS
jgi:uncharacterized ferritin-like protein (DUF455 family)